MFSADEKPPVLGNEEKPPVLRNEKNGPVLRSEEQGRVLRPEEGAPVPPSGEQVEIAHGRLRAVVTEVGGGLRALSDERGALLEGFAPTEMCSGGRGQALLPWPNRLGGGRYQFQGRSHQVAISEPIKGNAIHGLTRWVNWRVAERAADRAVMSYVLHPQTGYPFTLELTIEYSLSDRGLTVRTTGRNAGSQPLPYAEGFHPYVTVGGERIDGDLLTFPESSALEVDERQIPTGARTPVAGTPFDFRSPRQIRGTRLDTAFGDITRDGDGLARVRLERADGSRRVTVWMDGAHGYFMIFTGDTLDDSSRRRTGLGVEPMTCAPNALQSGEGLIVLDPGDSVTAAWGIEPG